MSQSEPVDSPLTQLAAAAVQVHELFRAFVDAGFTDDQALRLVIATLQQRPAA